MRNFTLKIVFMACIMAIASYSDAQFSINKDRRDNQSVVTDTETGVATFTVNFTSTRNSSRWYVNDDGSIGVKFEKTRNEKGWQSKVYTTADGTDVIYNDDFKVRSWSSNENPVHAHSIDSLKACLDKWQEANGGADGNTINKPSACLFDVDGNPDEQAFGTHPGMYKRVEYGFHFKFEGYMVTSDIEFEMDTYDAGNTGQTASYDLVVAMGSETNIIATEPNIYVSGTGKKTVKIAETAGIDISELSGQKIYFWLKTLGTGTPMQENSFDPTIVFDNMTVSYQLPVWIDPPAGAAGNTILGNEENPLVAIADIPVLDSIHLEIENRQGSLTIIDDLGDRKYDAVLNFNFMETGGLKANDGNGNYTIDVPYTYEAPVWNNGEWTKAKITVAADATPVDDMMFYFYATPTSSSLHSARLEMDCGVRIWYDYYIQGIGPNLDALNVSPGTLMPAFDPAVMEYQLTVPKGTTTVGFSVYSSVPGAVVTPPQGLALSDGKDVMATVTVASPEGTATKEYNVKIHVQSDKEILYLSADSKGVYNTAKDFDKNVFDELVDAGYSVTFAKKGSIYELTPDGVVPFDYTPYMGMVISAGESSSNVNDYAKRNYPIPCVTMQPDGPRSDKWGWVGVKKDDNQQMNVTKSYDPTTAQMVVTNNDHFITSVYDVNEVVNWTVGTAESPDWPGREVKSYNLSDSVPDAIPLATIPADGSSLSTMWAVPEGTSVRSMNGEYGVYERVTTSSNVVFMSLFNDGLLYPGDGFGPILIRSLEWALGNTADATLASLTPSEGALMPAFDPGKTEYQLNLPKGTSSVTISAEGNSALAEVTLPDALALSDGMTQTVTVAVKSADGTATTNYNVMVHVQSDNEILYVSANSAGSYGSSKAYDTNVYDKLVEAGYSVTFAKRGAIFEWTSGGIVPFDYTPFKGMVISAGESSSNVNDYAKRNYPIPCVSMQPDGPRVDKWGWTGVKKDDNKQMNVTKSYDPVTAQMVVKNNEHFITSIYTIDEVLNWTNGTADSADWSGREVKSYDLSDSIPEAVPLVTIPADGSSLTTMWAIPAGTSVRSMNGDYSVYERVTTSSNVVFMSLFNDGLLYVGDDFAEILVRALDWALGNASDASLASLTTSAGELAPDFNPEKTEYQLNLPVGTSSVSLSATATSQYAEVTVPDPLSPSNGMTEVMTVSVKSGDGSVTKEYNVMVHVQNNEEIMYLSAHSDGAYGSAKAYDTNVYDALVDAGYSVSFLKRGSINESTSDGIVPFDYTPYKGMVVSAGESSSNVNDYAKRNYPIPCVSMQPDGPRVDKWGWVGVKKDDNKQMNVTKTYDPATAQMVVTNNSHYITSEYNVNDVITWTTGTSESPDWSGREVKSYDLTDSVPGAIPLATIPADGSSLTTMWALPYSTSVRSMDGDYSTYKRVTTSSRVVFMSLFNDGLLYASNEFGSILVKSLEWVLGANLTDVNQFEIAEDVLVYPNPASNFAKMRFAIDNSAEVSISLVNLVGQKIQIVTKQRFERGVNEININTSGLNDGIYIYHLKVGSNTYTGKFNVAK